MLKQKSIIGLTLCVMIIMMVSTSSIEALDFPEIKGWTQDGDVSSYDPENLWKYINGAAELFIDFGFQTLRVSDFSAGDLKITMNIYDLGTALNAFGVYKLERGDKQEKLKIGSESVIMLPYQCLLLKDSLYVKIQVSEGKITPENAKSLLELVAQALPGENHLPAELKKLPENGKIEGSERFVKKGYLGLRELTNCIYADYEDENEKSYQIFYLIPEKKQSDNKLWAVFEQKWKQVEHKKYKILAREIPYRGLVGLIQKKGFTEFLLLKIPLN